MNLVPRGHGNPTLGNSSVECARALLAPDAALNRMAAGAASPYTRPLVFSNVSFKAMKGTRNSLSSLRIFLVAAETLNFSRAAEVLNLSQSAVSKHVGALEDRLGTALFKRLPTGLRLSYAGALYLERVSAGVRLIDEAMPWWRIPPRAWR